MAESTDTNVTGILEGAAAPYDFKGTIDATFAMACYSGGMPNPSNADGYIQHQMRALEASCVDGRDLIIQIGGHSEWHVPMLKAIAHSTVFKKKLENVTVRPKRLTIMHRALTPWVMDAMVHHWFFGYYDFDVIGAGIKDEAMIALTEAYDEGPWHQGPYATEGLPMAHLEVYQAAKVLGDSLLQETALGRFRISLSREFAVKALAALVKKAFAANFSKYDIDYSIRTLLCTYAYVWERKWRREGSVEYAAILKKTPQLDTMLQEARAEAEGVLQK